MGTAVLPHDTRVNRVVEINAQIARLQAEELTLLAELASEPPEGFHDGVPYSFTADELAGPLHITPGSASYRLDQASRLARFAGLTTLLASGAVTMRHLRVFDELTAFLDPDVALSVEARVLPKAAEQRPPAFTRALRRAILALDPVDPAQQVEQIEAGRRVVIQPREDGLTELWALLPAVDAAAINAAITALAGKTGPDDARTRDQRRADALTQLALDRLHGGTADLLPARHGRRPVIQVTVALTTLAGLDNQPGELAGEPIPAELARRIAADPTGTWRRLITNNTGQLIHLDPKKYKPPQAIADHVITRDQRCRFPGCERRADTTDLDHHVPFAQGGCTLPCNLGCLCRRHHLLKHLAQRWNITGNPEDTETWTDPQGHEHTSDPPELPGRENHGVIGYLRCPDCGRELDVG